MQILTTKEEQIMQVIWKLDHPCLISEILTADPTLKRNTVAPGLVDLANKGYIKVSSIGKSLTRTGRSYVAVISEQDYQKQTQLIYTILQKPHIHRGLFSCVSSLLSADETDEAFLKEISMLVENYKKGEREL